MSVSLSNVIETSHVDLYLKSIQCRARTFFVGTYVLWTLEHSDFLVA
jgi:hypothetical protein